jgi:hypothetical protein
VSPAAIAGVSLCALCEGGSSGFFFPVIHKFACGDLGNHDRIADHVGWSLLTARTSGHIVNPG